MVSTSELPPLLEEESVVVSRLELDDPPELEPPLEEPPLPEEPPLEELPPELELPEEDESDFEESSTVVSTLEESSDELSS